MNGFIANTPEGTKDRLFAECRSRRSAQSAITGLFKKRGYSEVVTPEVEYYDLFVRSGEPLPQESMLKIIDRSGKILVMRPDCTTPIARVAATKLKNSVFPQRLYYNQTIFRSDDAHLGNDSEIAQCGIELIGASGLRGDLEVVAMAVDTLLSTGVTNFHVELGHADLFSILSAELHADADTVERVRTCIENKSFAALSEVLEPFGDRPAARALRRLPYLFGGAEILDEAAQLLEGSAASEVIAYLRTIYENLSGTGRGAYLRFDLGLVNRVDYYTGLVFRAYVEGAGSTVLAGGRYDALIGCFGADMPASGFAVYVDALAACLPEVQRAKLDTLVHYSAARLGDALAFVDAQQPGTAELSVCETEEESVKLAASKGALRLVVLDKAGEREVAL